MAPTGTDFDVLIIGAGISGINAGYRIQSGSKPERSYAILESRGGIGGTWDLFKYPGIRSDSDLHTFGFPWRPWHEQKAIADGDSIVKYIRETASIHGIDKRVLFHHKVKHASWHSDSQKWSLDVDINGKEKKRFWANFIISSTGYYDYENPLPSQIPGLDNFKGTIVHPQFWPTDLKYAGKKMAIIGSGATAVTLLPNLARTAERVTMVQRSPGYLINLPEIDPTGRILKKILPTWLAHKLIRWKFLVLPWLFFNFCRAFPKLARAALRRRTTGELPKNIPHDPHFEPSYNPWEQRLCVAPDGDFYASLRDGRADIATGHIEAIQADGILMKSGQKIEADIIITATGLKIQIAGGATFDKDGEEYKIPDKFMWNGMMLQDLPNLAMVIGYTNASWTLGADATALAVVRIMNYMAANGISSAIPRVEDESKLEERPIFNLNSTYVKAGENKMPKTGDKFPWVARKNYFVDLWTAKFGDLKQGLQFFKVST